MKFLALATLALAANYVAAYCPNLCSGHGVCGAGDTCDCYKYTGTGRGDYTNGAVQYNTNLREAWTGADCSLRTCPVAYSWSGATPNGLGVSEAGTSASSAITITNDLTANSGVSMVKGSKVKFVDSASVTHDTYVVSIAANVVTVAAAVADGAGTLHYAEAEADSALDAKDANGAHGMLECSGQGLCDRTTGNCDCFPGYEGEACTRSVCPNDCSGNGICLSARRLATDAGHTYGVAWDADKHFGCKCDSGFRGPDCSLQECPSDFDPLYGCGGGECNYATQDLNSVACANAGYSDCTTGEQRDCSGRGICDYETGMCKCFSGFYGEACEKQTILI